MIEQDVSSSLDPGLIELQREVLRSGHPLRIRLHGKSMYPAIRPGDVALIRPLPWTDLRKGDVVFYERGGRLVAHRVIVPPFDGDSPLIAKGDTLLHYDPPVLPDQLMGRVEAVEQGGWVYSLTEGRGRLVQRAIAELSGPYSRLFWRFAAARRRILGMMLTSSAIRARRRAQSPGGQPRPCTPEDLDALANCLWDLQAGLPFARMREWTEGRIRRLQELGGVIWVIADGRTIVGAATASSLAPGREAWLIDLYIHPLARGRGMGSRLLTAVQAEAERRGAGRLSAWLPARGCAARRLWLKHGWLPASTGPRVVPGMAARLSDDGSAPAGDPGSGAPPEGFRTPDEPRCLWRRALEPAPSAEGAGHSFTTGIDR